MGVGELDRLSELLIRIYEANNRLFLRFSQLAAIEISGDLSTASILFRANTLLTKMPEAYMRIVGRSFLESSVGPVIRRICMTKVELEIDPAKLKSSLSSHQKDKTIKENGKELKKVANEIWQSIYINRSRCPTPLRKIFAKIQGLVGDAYVDQDMRLTSISAFFFLRFFVRAILTARLFNVIQFQPDSKSQRTLTLIAKTLQGLGNLTLFGIKEPWMSMMNEFISTQLDLFRDYVSYIASESDSTKPEWMSKEYEGYGLPYAASLVTGVVTRWDSDAGASAGSSARLLASGQFDSDHKAQELRRGLLLLLLQTPLLRAPAQDHHQVCRAAGRPVSPVHGDGRAHGEGLRALPP
jgi:hypothetical protein